MADLLLASASPRRRELLEQIGVNFICEAQDIDESILANESAGVYVERLAKEKALNAAKYSAMPVLGADTCVVLNGEILSKPLSKDDAFLMLKRLSGHSHQVLTGVALCSKKGDQLTLQSMVVTTDVSFINISDHQIKEYIATGEPMDKAGSYGIQGKAAVFVQQITGSYSNVVGLPLTETAELLRMNNVPIWCE